MTVHRDPSKVNLDSGFADPQASFDQHYQSAGQRAASAHSIWAAC
jgi:hypothetical protein